MYLITRALFLYLAFCDVFNQVVGATKTFSDYYGSPMVLDAFCENREKYISAFTLPESRLVVHGRPSDIADQLLKADTKGIETLHIELEEHTVETRSLNITHIQRFPLLHSLWIIAFDTDNTQKVNVDFQKYNETTELEITQIHFHFRFGLFGGFDSFLSFLHNITVFDIQNAPDMQTDHPVTDIFAGLKGIPLTFLSLRRVQMLFSRSLYLATWNLSAMFFDYFTNSLEYLDISRNDIQFLSRNIIGTFPKLRILDISNNMLARASFANIFPVLESSIPELFLFHPSLEAVDASRQFLKQSYESIYRPEVSQHLNIYKEESVPIRPHRSLNIFYNPTVEIRQCIVTSVNDIITNQTVFPDFLNCLMGRNKSSPSYIASKYIPNATDLLDSTCYGGLRFPLAPKLQDIRLDEIDNEFLHRGSMLNNEVACIVPENNLRSVRISSNKFADDIQKTVFSQIIGFEKMEYLYMRAMGNLRFMPNYCQFSPNLKGLFLGDNDNVISDDVKICKHLKQLTILELSNSNLKYLPQNFLENCQNLEFLDLSGNKFAMIQPIMRSDLNDIALHHKLRVNLSDNPLSCLCHDEAFKTIQWIRQSKVTFIDHVNYQCYSDNGFEIVIDKSLKEYEELCDYNNRNLVKAIILTAVSSFLVWAIVTSSCLAHRYRYRLQMYWYKARFFWYDRARNRNRDQTLPKFDYDIYISYSPYEYYFVFNTLEKWLEDKYEFKCCMQYRDCMPGVPIPDYISNGMVKSRIILVVLSKKSLKDGQFDTELDLAIYLKQDVDREYRRKLVYIVLEDIGDIRDGALKTSLRYSKSRYRLPWTYKPDCHTSDPDRELRKKVEKPFFEKIRAKLLKLLYKKNNREDVQSNETDTELYDLFERNSHRSEAAAADGDDRQKLLTKELEEAPVGAVHI